MNALPNGRTAMTNSDVVIAYRKRLLARLPGMTGKCGCCPRREALDARGDHAQRWESKRLNEERHRAVQLELADIFREAGILVRHEDRRRFFPVEDKRRMDITAEQWPSRGYTQMIDVTFVSTLTLPGTGEADSGQGEACRKRGRAERGATKSKERKYHDVSHALRPLSTFVVETRSGALGEQAKRILGKLAESISAKHEGRWHYSRVLSRLYQRISVACARGVAGKDHSIMAFAHAS